MEDPGIFATIEGLSPWWWVALGIVLGALEMLTMSFFLIWWGVAAIIMAILLVFLPTMPGEIQVALFAAISVALTFIGRSYVVKFGDGAEPVPGLNRRSGSLVGRSAKVVSADGSEGKVEIDGIPWRARSVEGNLPEPGALVEITASDGTTLSVKGA
jgi:inner membrane protein